MQPDEMSTPIILHATHPVILRTTLTRHPARSEAESQDLSRNPARCGMDAATTRSMTNCTT